MRFVLDANVVVSAIVGRRNPIARMLAAGADLILPEAQAVEVAVVLQRKFDVDQAEAYRLIEQVLSAVDLVATESLHPAEQAARDRLEARGQRDWPVLAAAMELGADIWSNDRDFFGVGVAVWKTLNIPFAIERAT